MQVSLDFITNTSWEVTCCRETMLQWNFSLEVVLLFPCKSGRWRRNSQEVKITKQNWKRKKTKTMWLYALYSLSHLGTAMCCLPWLRKGSDGRKYELAAGNTPVPDLLVKSSTVLRIGKETYRLSEDWGAVALQMDDLVDIWFSYSTEESVFGGMGVLFWKWVTCRTASLDLEYSFGETAKEHHSPKQLPNSLYTMETWVLILS